MIRVPPKADIDLRNSLLDIEARLQALERRETEKISGEIQIPQTGTDPDLEVDGDLIVANDVRIEGSVDAPHLYEGLIEVAPSGIPNDAQRVINLHSSLVIAPGGLSADSVRCRKLDVPIFGVALRVTSDQTISNNSVQDISWDAIWFDSGGFWDSSSPTIITIQEPGIYLVTSNVRMNSFTAAADRFRITLFPAATGVNAEQSVENTATFPSLSFAWVGYFASGTECKVAVYHNRGGDETIDANQASFCVVRIAT